jgi:hypothetical protein
MKRLIIFFVGFPLFSALSLPSPTNHPVSNTPPRNRYVKQGIRGCVYAVKGNQMPGPGVPRKKPTGIAASVYIFTLVNMSQVERSEKASFYKTVHARPVKVAEADSTGYFEASLDTGEYSLFIKVGEYYYSGVRDQYDNINPVKVYSSRQTYVELFYKSGAAY